MRKLILLFFLISTTAFAQKKLNIELNISNLPNQEVLLAYYQGERLYTHDTFRLNHHGLGVIQGEKRIPEGMYAVYLPSGEYFNIIMPADQRFVITTDTIDFIKLSKFRGSTENSLFFTYQAKLTDLNTEVKAKEFVAQYTTDSAELAQLTTEVRIIEKEINEYKQAFTRKHNKRFFAQMVRTTEHPELPQHIQANKERMYQYFRQHYLDNTNFNDTRLIRTPVLSKNIRAYLSDVIPQDADTAITELELMLKKTKLTEVKELILTEAFDVFNKSRVIGMDKAFVYVAEKYYLTPEVKWVTNEFKRRLTEQINLMKPSLIGNIAPDFTMQTHQGEYVNLHQQQANYIILYFWDPDCGHCKQEIPELHKFYKQNSENMQVMAVYTQLDGEKWKQFLDQNAFEWINCWDPNQLTDFREKYFIFSTPTIYILDKNKQILLKRIDLDGLKHFIKNN